MCIKSSISILLVTIFLCFLLNESQAKLFFEDVTHDSLLLDFDKHCALFADISSHNREKFNSVPKLDDLAFELRSPCRGERFTMSKAGKFRQVPAFNVDKITVAVITSNLDDMYVQEMAEAFNCRGGYNFLAIDTSKYLSTADYVSSAINVVELGARIATGLQNLGVDSENIHLIGHDLGAHTAGNAGFYYFLHTRKNISRITGLDPAMPCFKSRAIRSLRRDDAIFVDVIHSNPGGLGLKDPVGHADFYPGGLELVKASCDEKFICSHNLAISYFIETVIPGNKKNFMATRCYSLADLSENGCDGVKSPMGIGVRKAKKGIFNLSVKAYSPYGPNASSRSAKKCEVCYK